MSKITHKKISIFNKYGGEIDVFTTIGTDEEIVELSEDEFRLIDDLLQSMEMINKGVVSEGFRSKTIEKIKELTDDNGFKELTGN